MDKREVHNKTPNIEREAVDRVVKHLKESVNVVEITTDSSTSVTKMLGIFFLAYLLVNTADKYPRVCHSMDIWHKAKLLKKVLNNVEILYIPFFRAHTFLNYVQLSGQLIHVLYNIKIIMVLCY